MLTGFLEVDPEEQEKISDVHAVDDAQGIDFVDSRDGVGVFNLRKPRVGDVKLRVAFGLGNFKAQAVDFTRGNPQSAADLLQPLVGCQRLASRSFAISSRLEERINEAGQGPIAGSREG